ncbi:MAG: hypothetical protein QG597_1949 [Actinomycetota bacterium]|nr:hypothetical protein [Actinomycetota bacterium]
MPPAAVTGPHHNPNTGILIPVRTYVLVYDGVMSGEGTQRQWTFLSNHGHILVYVAAHPDARIRDVADDVGLTERAAQGILGDLSDAGYLTVTRVGRRNSYRINPELPLRHPHEADHTVGELLEVFGRSPVG